MFKLEFTTKTNLVIAFFMLLILVTPALASGEAVSIRRFATNQCTPGNSSSGIVSHINGTSSTTIRFSLSNVTRSTEQSFSSPIAPTGDYNFSLTVPTSTAVGDEMIVMIELIDAGGNLLVTDSIHYICGVRIISESAIFTDGRMNSRDAGAPVVLYVTGDGGLDIYAADGNGLIQSISATTINAVAECPANNTLIFDGAGISLWRLAGTCSFQLNAPATEAGKTYHIIFDTLSTNASYQSWED